MDLLGLQSSVCRESQKTPLLYLERLKDVGFHLSPPCPDPSPAAEISTSWERQGYPSVKSLSAEPRPGEASGRLWRGLSLAAVNPEATHSLWGGWGSFLGAFPDQNLNTINLQTPPEASPGSVWFSFLLILMSAAVSVTPQLRAGPLLH